MTAQSSLPFTDEQIAATRKTCCEWEYAADADLAEAVLRTLAGMMDRDEQYRGMYGPLRSWRVAGPWIDAKERGSDA